MIPDDGSDAIFASTYFSAESVLFDGPIKHGRDCWYQSGGGAASQPYWLKLPKRQHIHRLRVWGTGRTDADSEPTISMAENA